MIVICDASDMETADRVSRELDAHQTVVIIRKEDYQNHAEFIYMGQGKNQGAVSKQLLFCHSEERSDGGFFF